jgi:cation diffusion facilitator family transporter
MDSTQHSDGKQRADASKRVTLLGAVVNIALAAGKIVGGLLAHSVSLVADGIHSFSDLLSDALVYWGAHHAGHGPDEKHPYGHGRFETAATLGLGGLLLLVAIGIGWDAVDRLFSPERLVRPEALALWIAFGAIVIKEGLYHYTMRAAQQLRSDMLKANAWHHRSDALSSVLVLVGVGGTMAGLPYLDAIAAIGVALMVAKIGWELGLAALHELVDAGLEGERLEKIRSTILTIGGVGDIHMLRTRQIGSQVSVDVHVLVEPWISVSEGHQISQTVIDALHEQCSEVGDVTVHIDPEDDAIAPPCKGLPLRVEAIALLDELWQGVPGVTERERILLHYLEGRIDVELYYSTGAVGDIRQRTELEETLQQRLHGSDIFRRVRLFYG